MLVERLNDNVEIPQVFSKPENALNVSGGTEMTVLATTRIGWMRFRECRVIYKRL